MVQLDTTVKSFRLENGVKVQTAVDLVSGKTYIKIAPWMPWKNKHSLPAGQHTLAEAIDAKGGFHFPHDDEWFRGVWQPEPTKVEADEEEEVGTHRSSKGKR